MTSANPGGHPGDDGTSGLIGGIRRSKSDPVFHCLGWIDELNAALGALRVVLPGHEGADTKRLGEPGSGSSGAGSQPGDARSQPHVTGSDPVGRLGREVRSVQLVLGRLMGGIATRGPNGGPPAATTRDPATTVTPEDVALLEAMEHEILVATDVQPRFYVPGDSTPEAAAADVARARCRTAERAFVDYLNAGEAVTGFPAGRIPEHFDHGRRFLNRLSDYLFALARYLDAPQE